MKIKRVKQGVYVTESINGTPWTIGKTWNGPWRATPNADHLGFIPFEAKTKSELILKIPGQQKLAEFVR